jgi:hypothetical protein
MKNGVFALLLLCAAGCAHTPRTPASTPAPQSTMTLLLDSRGVRVPLERAIEQIAFRPFVPGPQIAAVALIPPLGGVDRRESHGVAIEYASAGDALVLSEWPRLNFDVTGSPCAPVAYKPDGLIWSTRNGLVMTLQADGAVQPSRIVREAHRLLQAGACRGFR